LSAVEALAVQGLSKSYRGHQVVQDFTLTAIRGEILGLIGGNGAGKTTSLRMIAGLLAPDGGTGTILGLDVIRDRQALKASVGFMSQSHALYADLTLRENLLARARLFGLKDAEAKVDHRIEQDGLVGYASYPVGTLSGGWLRRAQFATCLIHDSNLLILDEPTAGLDLAARDDLWRKITDLARQGRSVIVSTHDLLEIAACDRIALMQAGRIVRMGAPQAIAGSDKITDLRAVLCDLTRKNAEA
jgi:ABC-2 type transport system ATP-binding protein